MARRYPKKEYEFIRGVDWVYDRLFFDGIDDVVSVTTSMSEPEYKALNALRAFCHNKLGDDYKGLMPTIEIKD